MEKSIENKLAENFANKLKDLQKEGLFENVKSFDLNFTGKGINIKLNENGQTSKYPLTEAYFNIISVDDIWSSFNFSNTYSFYSELEDETGIDYDDIKDQCWDCTPEYETEEVVNQLGAMGSEQFLSKYFTSPEDIKSKSWEELANIETEDGQDLMELIMDEFIDITDYADELYHDAYEAAKEELEGHNYNEDDDEED